MKSVPELQNGVSLLEILITVAILSIGLLGLGALQAMGVSSTHDSYLRGQANMLINEMTERMSINIDEVDNNTFNIGNFNMATCAGGINPKCEGTTTCTTDELAAYDIFQLACGAGAGANDGISNMFPSGTLNITCNDSVPAPTDADDCTDGSTHTITITWQKSNSDGGIADQVQMVVVP